MVTLYVALLLFVLLGFLIVVGWLFSHDEFSMRSAWLVRDPSTNRIDWAKVDAGRFCLYWLIKAWQAVGVLLVCIILGRVVWQVI